jgi:hypothetical protein
MGNPTAALSVLTDQSVEVWASSKGDDSIHIRFKLSNGAHFSRLNVATNVHLFDKDKKELLRYNAHIGCPAALGRHDQHRYYDFDAKANSGIWHDAATVVVDAGKACPTRRPIAPMVVYQRNP